MSLLFFGLIYSTGMSLNSIQILHLRLYINWFFLKPDISVEKAVTVLLGSFRDLAFFIHTYPQDDGTNRVVFKTSVG